VEWPGAEIKPAGAEQGVAVELWPPWLGGRIGTCRHRQAVLQPGASRQA